MVFVSLLVLVLIILHVLIVYDGKSSRFCADQRILNGEIRFSRLGPRRVTVVCITESSLSGSTVLYRSADCSSADRFAALIVRLENHCIPDFVLTEASRSLKTDSTGAPMYIPHRRPSVDDVTGEPRLSMTSRPDIRTLFAGQEHVILSTSSPDLIILEPVTSFLNRLIVGRVQPPPLETILSTAGHYQTNGISLSDGGTVRIDSSITDGDEFTVIGRRFVVDDSEENFSDDCVICQETLGTTVFTQLPCRHAFHSECITEWLTMRRNCPTCRHSLVRKQV
jgi:hypothetical protein